MPHKKTPTPDHLDAYRAKRSLERTPEPAGSVSPRWRPAGCSWCTSTPPGGSTSIYGSKWMACFGPGRCPRVRRTTRPTSGSRSMVEDHPLEYGDFEGLIPDGNYGAGAVIVWDRGRWVPVEDPLAGLAKGKLLFELRGHKLHGLWTLVKLKKGEKEWLLIKERDGCASAPARGHPRVGAVRAHGGGPQGGPDAARLSGRSSTRLGAPKRRSRGREAVGADAGRDGRGEPSRDRRGCSSSSSTATGCSPRAAAASRDSSPGTATTCAASFPEVTRAVAALPVRPAGARRRSGCARRGRAPQLSAAAAAGAAHRGRSISGRRRWRTR